jgi:cobalt-zinc-cadmium efflux system protein
MQEKLSLQRISKLKTVFLLTSFYLVAEIIGGLLTGSLALIADAGHMATDAAGLGLALFAMNFGRRPRTPQRTYGFYRMEILASLSNSIVLILLSIYIIYEAYRRIIEPPEVQSFTMLIVAFVGLAVNLAGIFILKGRGGGGHSHQAILSSTLLSLRHDHKQDGEVDVKSGKHDRIGAEVKEEENLNMQGAYLEVLSDALGSIGVITAGIKPFCKRLILFLKKNSR